MTGTFSRWYRKRCQLCTLLVDIVWSKHCQGPTGVHFRQRHPGFFHACQEDFLTCSLELCQSVFPLSRSSHPAKVCRGSRLTRLLLCKAQPQQPPPTLNVLNPMAAKVAARARAPAPLPLLHASSWTTVLLKKALRMQCARREVVAVNNTVQSKEQNRTAKLHNEKQKTTNLANWQTLSHTWQQTRNTATSSLIMRHAAQFTKPVNVPAQRQVSSGTRRDTTREHSESQRR